MRKKYFMFCFFISCFCMFNPLQALDSTYRELLNQTLWHDNNPFFDKCNFYYYTLDSLYEIVFYSSNKEEYCFDKKYYTKWMKPNVDEIDVRASAYGFYDSSLIRYGEDSLKDNGKYMYQYQHSFKDIEFTETEMTTSQYFGYKVENPFEFHLSADRQHLLLKYTNHTFYYKDGWAGFTDVDYDRIYGLPKKVVEALKLRGLKQLPPILEPKLKKHAPVVVIKPKATKPPKKIVKHKLKRR